MLAPAKTIFVLLLGTAFAMHIVSCFWYLAGTSSDLVQGSNPPRMKDGWVIRT